MSDDGGTPPEIGLEDRLGLLLEQERFPAPATFRAEAAVQDDRLWQHGAEDPDGFWLEQARTLAWHVEPTEALTVDDPPWATWFADGRLNVAANCVDRHVDAGHGEHVAFHWRGEDGSRRTITYADLHHDCQRFANVLLDHGVGPGDVVGIYLPMIPEVVTAMLACARIGAPHNVVFGGFSAQAVGERMAVSGAKVLITADGQRRKGRTVPVKATLDAALDGLPALETVLVVRHTGTEAPMTPGRDRFWDEAMAAAAPDCPAEPFGAEHPLFILYSSGSTATPKGIVHTSGGYLTGAAFTHRLVFDLRPETDVYWCAADVGWITGHSYIVYGPLANGCTSVMYEGAPDHPDKDAWWQIVEDLGVTILYTAPTAVRTCMRWGPEYPGRHDLSSLRLLGSVGEPINPKAWLWYHEVIGGGRCPIVDTWWQTETGSIMVAPIPGVVDAKPGAAMRALPGVQIAVLAPDGSDAGTAPGVLTITRPWPSMARTLLDDPDRYRETYWSRFGPAVYLAGDAARIDEDGDLWVIGRIDDVLNVSGHRMSTAEIESAIVAHPDVAEAAVIGQHDPYTGQSVTAFVTLRAGMVESPDVAASIGQTVATRIGKIARPKRIVWADDLPKTRSGKIMRRLLRDIADGRELGDVTTLRDPDVVAQLSARIAARSEEDA